MLSENTPLTAHVLGTWQLILTLVPHGVLPNVDTPYNTQRNSLYNSTKTRTAFAVMTVKQLSASCSKNCNILLVGVVYHKRAVMAGSKTRRGILNNNIQSTEISSREQDTSTSFFCALWGRKSQVPESISVTKMPLDNVHLCHFNQLLACHNKFQK
jgi:hypothetical protein